MEGIGHLGTPIHTVDVQATVEGYVWRTSATGLNVWMSRTMIEMEATAIAVIEEATGQPVTHGMTTFNIYRPALPVAPALPPESFDGPAEGMHPLSGQ